MKIKHLKLKNFRAFAQETQIDISDLNVFIGKNDIGKSSILEALDIFFNGKPDKNDLSVNHDNSKIEFTCIFDNFSEEIILDDVVVTNLKDEFLLNIDNLLEIKKRFSVSAGGTITEETVVVCNHPDNPEVVDLLSKKRTTLRLQFAALGLNPEGVNQNISKELRNAIRNHFFQDGNITTSSVEIKIDGKLDNEDNRKKIWSSLKNYLPLYSLCFVDKPLNDQDSDIQDPMKEIIKEVLRRDNIAPLLAQLKEEIQLASTNLADQTIAKFNELDTSLAETLQSNFPKEPTWDSIFKLTLEDDRGVPLNKRGSGLRRLVLLSFFRAQIENRRTENAPNIIYALEEPETSQHPNFQLMVVKALIELSETENAQVLFTTHNSNLAKEIPKSSLRLVFKHNGNINVENGTNSEGTDNPQIIDQIIATLGALPDPKNKVKVLIFVEGENDINGLIGLSKILNANDSAILNLENNEAIAFIPTGGSQLKFYIEKKYLDGLLQSQVHIYDSDIPYYVQCIADLNAEANPKKFGFNTLKSELENYLHHEAIIETYEELHIPIVLTQIEDQEDVPKKVAIAVNTATGVSPWNELNADPIKNAEKQGKKISYAKRQLSTKVIEKMNVERLIERDGYDEIKSWLDKIADMIQLAST